MTRFDRLHWHRRDHPEQRRERNEDPAGRVRCQGRHRGRHEDGDAQERDESAVSEHGWSLSATVRGTLRRCKRAHRRRLTLAGS